MGHKRMPGLRLVGDVWHIQKRVRGYGTLRESTQATEIEEAERYLVRRLDEIRQQVVYGMRPRHLFADAAAKFVEEDVSKGRADNAAWLAQALPFIGHLHLGNIHDATLKPFVDWCLARGNKGNTIGNKLGVIRQILRLAAGKWRDDVTGMTWLDHPPILTIPDDSDRREPYPISWREQAFLLPLLPAHLQPMALFMVHTGLRDDECCGLRWDWERDVEELGVSVFVIPKSVAKNREERVVMLNAVARRVIDAQRGVHEDFVFTYRHNSGRSQGGPGRINHKPKPARRVGTMNNTGWQAARRLATERYREVFGRAAPAGFATLHVHDLRHTFGRRLRAAGVSQETRQALLGHKNGNITTHYSAAELLELHQAVALIEAGASAPLLQSVQKTCNPGNEKGLAMMANPLIVNGAPGRI